jgi:hypothetical protein
VTARVSFSQFCEVEKLANNIKRETVNFVKIALEKQICQKFSQRNNCQGVKNLPKKQMLIVTCQYLNSCNSGLPVAACGF